MKHTLLALCTALLLTSCASVRVVHTDIATGAVNPVSIYIRPFDVNDCTFIGRHQSPPERAIRKSLAPAEFAEALKEDLEKMAPAMVLREDEEPSTGWLVEGSLDIVNAGHPSQRATPAGFLGTGATHVLIHVRVIDVSKRKIRATDSKDVGEAQTAAGNSSEGPVIYEFDVAGGSRNTGALGSVTAPGMGYGPMFDYHNAAERIYEAITPDEFRNGLRDGPSIR